MNDADYKTINILVKAAFLYNYFKYRSLDKTTYFKMVIHTGGGINDPNFSVWY